MRIVERPDIKGDFVPCIECGSKTRSHRLENPRYEEYEEVWEDELEEYQGRKKQDEEEEEEVVIRYRLVDSQVCMCHRCWVVKRDRAVTFLNKHKDDWVSDTSSYLRRIRKFLQSWAYYQFDSEVNAETMAHVEEVKNALALTAGLGEEE